MSVKPIVITPGEPAGIGPDLLLQLMQKPQLARLVVISDPQLFEQRAKLLGLPFRWQHYQPASSAKEGAIEFLVNPLPCLPQPGQPDPRCAASLLTGLDRAVDGCLAGGFEALVTGPMQKSVINDAGIPFSGHTEYLAERSGAYLPVMMLMADELKVALVTTHLPLKEVSDAITEQRLTEIITILNHDLGKRFSLDPVRIFVCGLNPHAGEQGHLGDEELTVIIPTLEKLRSEGMVLTGPLPADTIFTAKYMEQADVILAMYHDQGLPVLKHLGFGRSVNVTLGLPFVRTSVDHGTALDLAGTGSADLGSLEQAIRIAQQMSLSHT